MPNDQNLSTEDLAQRRVTADDVPASEPDVSLLDPEQADRFRTRWSEVQTRFVDDPREAVGTADGLVAELMQALASSFADHKTRLEAEWNSGGGAGTEDLRLALQRYRSFFHRLLET